MTILKRLQTSWAYPTALLCIYGFLSTIKPLEPFITMYLTGPDKNLTTEQVNNQIFPVWTYSYLALLVPVFLLTDYLRYKPVIIFQALNLWVTTGMILWAQGVVPMQWMQVFYSIVTACDVAYFSYIYSVVGLEHFQKVTAYCRGIQLMGFTVGSVLGQVLVSFNLLSYKGILIFNLILISLALITSCFLPMPQSSMIFHRQQFESDLNANPQKHANNSVGTPVAGRINDLPIEHIEVQADACREVAEVDIPSGGKSSMEKDGRCSNKAPTEAPKTCMTILIKLWRDFLQCYSRQLLYWSIWWALATCGYNLTVNYIQVLWEHLAPVQNSTIYNGGVEAASNLFSSMMAYMVACTKMNWATWGELSLGIFSGFGAGALFLMTFTVNIWICYAGYIIFKCLYMLLITVAMFQIAAGLSVERHALIFGANTFGSLVLQTFITAVVVDGRGLNLDIISQFIVFGGYFSAISLLFFLRGLYTMTRQSRIYRINISA